MSETTERVIKSTQEQAVAAWISYLNQARLDELIIKLNQQDINLEESLKELEEIKQFIGDPTHILGSATTKHGEIAEHMQVNFANARRAIQGLSKNHTFDGVGRTAPEDYIRDGQQVQSKFYNGLKSTFFGKHALLEHMETYPDFVKNGGSYDIPKDQYEKMVELLDKYKKNPSQLNTSDYNLAKKIDDFLNSKGMELGKDINPSVAEYKEVQQGTVNQTINREENSIHEEDVKRREQAYQNARPTLKEGVTAVGVSSTVEGGITFCISVARKRKEKNFSEFTVDDWKEVGIDTGKGAVKGGIRGGVIYTLTNFTATPANVASAYVTAAFGIVSQTKALEEGKVSEEDFIINCETICLDVTVSAIASVVGQALIPIPILGAVVGNVTGEFIYELCKKQGTAKSQIVIEKYHKEIARLNQQLDADLYALILKVRKELQKFNELEQFAFDEDVNKAFLGSIKLATELGVPEEKILMTMEDTDNFFMN